jgi:hydrophobe/amphiphile efflux-1 (HAE1) family protein
MNLSAPFIRRPVATSLMMMAIALGGIVSFPELPVAPLPQVDFPTVSVSAQLPGASPETMASSVATPLERQLAQIAGITQMASVSTRGSTSITLQFELTRNIDSAAQDVQAAISAAGRQLPRDLTSTPTYRKVNPADSPVLILAVHSDALPLTTVDEYADTRLAQQISQITGVSQVSIGGEQKPAVRIQIDPVKLAASGLTFEDVRAALLDATVDAPKGTVNDAKTTFTITANDQLTRSDEYANVIIAFRNGVPLRVSDIGQAVDGPENNQVAAWMNNKRSVLLIIFKQPGANVINTIDRVKAQLPQLMAALPPSVAVETVLDRTQTIRASILDVERTLLLTIVLVIGVILFFLRNFWATLIPGITIPLALLGSVAAMYMAGFSLDNLSLMALTISVGFVVDDAVVVVENIFRHLRQGASPLEAALEGSKEIWFTVLSISISLVAVFIPLLLMGGIVGRLFREFALTVTAAIAISAGVSLTLAPMLSARFMKPALTPHGSIGKILEQLFDRTLSGYGRSLDLALRHRSKVLLAFLATFVLTIVLFIQIPKGFFPTQDTGIILGTSEAAQSSSPAEMMRFQENLGEVLLHEPAIAAFSSATGSGGGASTSNTGRFFIQLKARSERDATASEVIDRLRPQLAKVANVALFLQPAQDITVGGRVSRAQFQYTLQDSNLDELSVWAPKVLAKLRSLPEIVDVSTDQEIDTPQANIRINRDQAARFGIQPQLIDDTLNDAFGQRQATQYFTQVNSYSVVLEEAPVRAGDLSSLDQIYVKSPLTGTAVPLSTLVTVDTKPVGALSISHLGQFPAVTFFFNLRPGVSLGQAVSEINAASAQIGSPATLVGRFQGNALAFQTSLSSEPVLIAAALIVIYIVLGILYESYIHPLTILSTLPSAGVGALLALQLGGFDLSVIGIIAIILLIGIVKKNGIMMVDFAIKGERQGGLAPEEAIREACILRLRPILMTTAATLIAGLPLMLGHGTGSELRQPLGWAMVGGLLASQLLTLYTTPIIYLFLDRLHRRLTGADTFKATGSQAQSQDFTR